MMRTGRPLHPHEDAYVMLMQMFEDIMASPAPVVVPRGYAGSSFAELHPKVLRPLFQSVAHLLLLPAWSSRPYLFRHPEGGVHLEILKGQEEHHVSIYLTPKESAPEELICIIEIDAFNDLLNEHYNDIAVCEVEHFSARFATLWQEWMEARHLSPPKE